jgi:hypothetical protein
MTLRRRAAPPGVSSALEHYLVSGCFSGGLTLEQFTLAGAVLGGRLDGLRALWRDAGPVVKATHRGPTFAESVLALPEGSWREVSALSGRARCREHNRMKEEEQR